ncbi:MAG: hypothetical protein BWY21_00889 [Parcubacteria group bacterium ADurb.Bin216]|nr:MAG: hypothetical protein BWY21_00889 [Parcubacteria group bacterium ADurb.Bin216]
MYATDNTEYTEALTGCTTTLQSINGECPAETNAYTIPTATCISGNPSSISGEGPWTWVCEGINGGTNSSTCTVNKSIDGVCGTANRTYVSTEISYGLDTYCSAGNSSSPPSFPTQGTSSSWTCLGLNGGLEVDCVASREKGDQSAPGAPTMASRTSSSITLNTISGGEYRLGNNSWQSSNVFNGLSPNVSYLFTQRYAESLTQNASLGSLGVSFLTDKANQSAPAAPTMASRTSSSITLNAISNGEYSYNDSSVFFNGATGTYIGLVASLNNKPNWTWTGWVYRLNGNNIYTEGNPSVTFAITSHASGITVASWNANRTSNWTWTTLSGANFNTGEWKYLSLTLENGAVDSGTIKMYFDGQYISSGASQMEYNSSTKYAVFGNNVGYFYGGTQGSGAFSGGLSGIRIYNRALSASEIANLYNGQNITSGLIGYWSMSDGSGTVLTDFSGQGNTGALNGITWASGPRPWQTTTTFSGLKSGNSYLFTQRYKETSTQYVSPSSPTGSFIPQ